MTLEVSLRCHDGVKNRTLPVCVEVRLVEGARVCVCVHMCMHVFVWCLQCVIRHLCMCVDRVCTVRGEVCVHISDHNLPNAATL